MIKYLIYVSALMSVISFILMGTDKFLAKKHARRISEKTLMLCAFFLGGIGVYIGMYTFRHKTKHIKFTLGVPLLIILNIVIITAASNCI